MTHYGDYDLGDTIHMMFTTRGTDGVPAANASIMTLVVYEDNSTTEITAAETLTANFDTRNGQHHVSVAATGGNGFEVGKFYHVAVSAGTVGTASIVGEVVGSFTIEATSALRPATGQREIVIDANGRVDVGSVLGTAQTANDNGADINTLVSRIPDTLSLANINAEVDTALTDIHLDHLLAADYDPAAKPGTATALLNELVESNGGVSRFTSNALEQVWSVGTRLLTAGTNIVLAKGVGVTGFNDVSTAEVNTEVDTALTDIHLDHLFATDYDPASKPGTATALLNELVENDLGVSRFTANALEQGPDTTTGLSVDTVNDKTGYSLTQTFPTNFADLAITATTGLVTVGTNNDKTGYSISGSITTLDGLNDLSAAEVNTEVDTALTDIHLDHLLAVDYDPAAKPGTATALLNELVENDGGISRFTANALELGPTGGGSTAVSRLATGTAQGGTTSTIQLASSETFANDELNGNIVNIISGTGAGQSRVIIDHVGATDTSTVVPNWVTTPDATSVYEIIHGSANVTAVDLVEQTANDNGGDLNTLISRIPDTLSLANINTEVDTALTDIHLDHLLAVDYDPASKPGVATALFNEIIESNGGVSRFTSGALEQTWSVGTRVLTAGTNIVLAKGTGVTGFNDLSAAQVNTEVDTALTDIHLDHLLAVDYDPATPPGVATALFNEIIESDGGVARFTANALELAPDTTTGLSVDTVNDKTGYSLTQTFPTNFADLAITATTGRVTVGTNNDKTGYSISGTKTTLDALNDITTAQVNTEVDTALTDIHLDHLFATDYDPAAKPGTATALLNELIENDGGVSRYTANALEQAPTGGSIPAVSRFATGTAQGGTASTIQLATGETFADDEPNGNIVNVISGTGAGQSRVIIDYVGSTDTATVSPNWTTNPDATSVYEIIHGSTNVAAVNLVAQTGNDNGADINTILTRIPDTLSLANINAEADTALTDIHLDHLFATDYDPASKPGTATALLNELIENDGGVSRYTANALEQAPTGGSIPAVSRFATGTAQGGTASTIQLATGETFADDEPNGNIVNVISGTGAGQSRVIIDYVGSTDTATVSPNWTTNPDATSVYEIIHGSTNVAAVSLTAQTANDNGLDINTLITRIPDTLSLVNINAEVDTALTDIHLDHLLATDYDPASPPGTATALLNELVENDGGISRFTANALELGPTGGSIPAQSRLATGTAQSGTASTIQLASSETFGNDILNGAVANIISGTGAGQTRVIIDYVGATDTATVSPNWTTNPDATSVYEIVHGSTNVTTINLVAQTANDNGLDINTLLTRVPDTLSLANINAEVDTALTDIHLDHLLAVNYDPTAKPGVSTALLNELVESDAGISRFTANALEQGPDTTTGLSVDTVNDKTGYSLTQTFPTNFADLAITASTGRVTVGTNNDKTGYSISGTKTTLDALNDITTAQVNTEVDTALTDIHLDHLFATNYDPSSKPGTATALLNELIENDGGVSRFTANALEQGPDTTTGLSLSQAFPTNFADLAITATTGLVTVGTNNDKTGYSLTQTFPTNFADLAITATTGRVTVGTNNDKTGYSLSQAFPTNFADLAITASTGRVTVGTNNDKAGYTISGTLTTLDSLNNLDAAAVNAEMVDVLTVDTFALPGQENPPVAPTLTQAMGWLYKSFRNRGQQDDSEWRLFADNNSTVDAKATLSKASGIVTKGKVETGP